MPTAYVQKLAKEYHVSVEEAESVWEAAKENVGLKEGKPQWPLIMMVFKRMMDERKNKLKKKKP